MPGNWQWEAHIAMVTGVGGWVFTPTPRLQQGENLSSLSVWAQWWGGGIVWFCEWLQSRLPGRDVPPSFCPRQHLFNHAPDDWTEGQIWRCHVCHLDEHGTESLMGSARLFCLRLSCYRWASPRASQSFNVLMGRIPSSLAMHGPN